MEVAIVKELRYLRQKQMGKQVATIKETPGKKTSHCIKKKNQKEKCKSRILVISSEQNKMVSCK